MTRLILTFTDSSAGALKSARLADCVVGVGLRFVWGKLPSAHELDLLLSPRSAMPEVSASRWSDHLTGERIADARSRGLGLIEFAEPFEAIEIWVGPEPNSQLQLVWLLNYLQPHADLVSRLTLVQVDASIGDLLLDELSRWRSQAAPIRNDALESAGAAWAAWRAPTPESWFDLLARDLETLPRLRETVISLLEELPMPGSGLGATEMRMLELVAPGRVHSFDVFPGYEKPNNRRVFSYWELGSLLDGLAHCPASGRRTIHAGDARRPRALPALQAEHAVAHPARRGHFGRRRRFQPA